MPLHPRHTILAAATCLALAGMGCATVPAASALVAGSEARVEGRIASIDTDPWAYDGNAVVMLDTAAHGRVPVQLPARWNLCKARPVDVAALAVGQKARAVGTVAAEGGLVVCERSEHRLVAAD